MLPDIEGFTLTAGSKTDLIQRLSVAVEQRRVSWPAGSAGRVISAQLSVNRGEKAERISGGGAEIAGGRGTDWEILTNEMKRYEYQIGAAGRITYGAPAGYHDDCVIALALANHRRCETQTCGRMMRISAEWMERHRMRPRGRERTINL